MTGMRSSSATTRVLISAAASAALLMTAVSSTFAAPVTVPQQPVATVVGTVTCGPSEEAPASQAVVSVAGSDISVRAGEGGKFTLAQVPTGQALTIEAMSDPLGTVVSTRPDVSLQAGETLDIGNLDLATCPQPEAVPATTDQQVLDITQFPQQ